MHLQGDIRELFDKLANHRWQHVSTLGMGGRHRQAALGLIPVFVRKRPDAVDLVDDFPGSLQDGLSGRGDS